MGSAADLASAIVTLLPGKATLLLQAEALLASCRATGLTMVTAESCTGGLIAATLTAIAGSSDVFAGGLVTYTNALKTALLDVPATLLESDGAVSRAVALAMVAGALTRTNADLAVAVTGIAGPGGATPGKPVGTVWLAAGRRGTPALAARTIFPGTRAEVRAATVEAALAMLAELLPRV